LTGGQHQEGKNDRQRQPQCRMQPYRRPEGYFHGKHEADHDVADNDDGEVGRRVVGALVMQCLAAIGAGIGDLEITAEHGAGAAGGAAPRRASQQGAKDWARACRSSFMLVPARRPKTLSHHSIPL